LGENRNRDAKFQENAEKWENFQHFSTLPVFFFPFFWCYLHFFFFPLSDFGPSQSSRGPSLENHRSRLEVTQKSLKTPQK